MGDKLSNNSIMKISIITPTNNPVFLKELEDTILSQSYSNWEWIILLNQGAKYEASDDRIKIIESPFVSDSVGFLKRLACMNATGEIIAEVDHDDLLTKDCLGKVAEAFKEDGIGFVYSRNAKLSDNFRPYMAEYGWEHSKFKWNNKSLYAMHNQPLFPGRLGHIWFAPDHIRAWRRDVYEGIGGHNDTLKVCDDLDLMHRLYKVTKFKEIAEVLYIYRITGENAYVKKSQMIRELNERIYDKNISCLAERFAEISGLMKADLLPSDMDLHLIPSNSVGLIKAYDVLQYVKDQRVFMSELHRILAPGGMLISETPSTDGRGAFADPLAHSYWNEASFWYFTRGDYAYKIRNKKMFRECKLKTEYKDEYAKENRVPHVIAHLEKLI